MSGRHTTTEITGRVYPQSTGAWVGCSQPATLAYRIEVGDAVLVYATDHEPHDVDLAGPHQRADLLAGQDDDARSRHVERGGE